MIGMVLGLVADHGVHVDRIVISDLGSAGEVGAGEDLVVRAKFDSVLDDDVRANNVIDPDLDVLADNGASMDFRHGRDYITTVRIRNYKFESRTPSGVRSGRFLSPMNCNRSNHPDLTPGLKPGLTGEFTEHLNGYRRFTLGYYEGID